MPCRGGVRDRICRVQQRLVGKGCDRAVETCLVFAPMENAFALSTVDRVITKKEALHILRATEEAGLVHTAGNYRAGIDYICNCCTCCCGILRGVAEFGILTAVARSDFHMVVETVTCSGCGICIERWRVRRSPASVPAVVTLCFLKPRPQFPGLFLQTLRLPGNLRIAIMRSANVEGFSRARSEPWPA